VLPAAHRLVDGETFRTAVRRGRRAGSRTVVAHLLVDGADEAPAQVGFVVSKAVGNSVVRNRVKRRLRHLTRDHLPQLQELPGRVVLVVRALPGAATASYEGLGADLSHAISRVTP
jgi:ribonuclease P protein component